MTIVQRHQSLQSEPLSPNKSMTPAYQLINIAKRCARNSSDLEAMPSVNPLAAGPSTQ